jgi:hypothetical protein
MRMESLERAAKKMNQWLGQIENMQDVPRKNHEVGNMNEEYIPVLWKAEHEVKTEENIANVTGSRY